MLGRERRAPSEAELRKLYRLWDEAQSSAPAGVVLGPLPSCEELEDEFGSEPEPPTRPPAKPRHRPADGFPWATIERCDELLAARRTALEMGASMDGLSQVAIARELSTLPPGINFDDTRVQRAEKVRDLALGAKGWDLRALLKSHPEFCVGNDTWTLPGPEKAADLLGL